MTLQTGDEMVSTPALRKDQVSEILLRQAALLFGSERAEALRQTLEERAYHVWRVLSTPVSPEDRP